MLDVMERPPKPSSAGYSEFANKSVIESENKDAKQPTQDSINMAANNTGKNAKNDWINLPKLRRKKKKKSMEIQVLVCLCRVSFDYVLRACTCLSINGCETGSGYLGVFVRHVQRNKE